MNEQLKSNLLSKKHWVRLLYMVFFAALFYVAFLVIWVAVAVQFLFALINGSDNDNVRKLGSSLSQFVFQITQFLTYNSDVKPFPFADWPEPVERVKDEVEQASTVAGSSDEASLADKAPDEAGQNNDCDVSGETSLDTEDETKGDIKSSGEHDSSIETVDSLLNTDDSADETSSDETSSDETSSDETSSDETSSDETSAEPQAVEEELSEEMSEQEKEYISEEVEGELVQTSSVTSSADDSEEKPFSKNR